MPTKFTTSINIIRDKGKELNYFPTPNGLRVVNQIVQDFKNGSRSFNIIGSYGTGKSAFLWAFQESIRKNKRYFGVNFLESQKPEFIELIGEYKSLKKVFSEYFDLKGDNQKPEFLFSEIFNKYYDLGSKNPILFVLIDEFGKFLEYASQNDPETEIYFIQQLSEFVNNPDSNIVLITTVHQNFDAYALGLDQSQKKEWTKVKGRFKEITFNEPVEQLLFLASEHLSKIPIANDYKIEVSRPVSLLSNSKAFNINEEYIGEIAEKLFPLDAISAYVITIALQKYGQNERSLFSFLESTDLTGLYHHSQNKTGFYSISDVYEFLIFNYYNFLNSKFNPDFSAWRAIKSALEKVETSFDENIESYSRIIKVIGLLNINAQAGANLDKEFIQNYAQQCLSINNAELLIDDLILKKIIIYRNHNKRFGLFEGTDLDIQTALIEAETKVNEVSDVVTLIKKYYQLPPVIAKKVFYETGTPRLFEYRISSEPLIEQPSGELDGFINLIFNEKNILDEVINFSKNCEKAILYCYYKSSKAIKDLLFEIEKTKKVIMENSEDKVAVRELNNIVLHQRNLLNHKILNNFTGSKSDIVWVFNGKVIEIKSKREFNSTLSEICNVVYSKSPIFNNELVNKHKISSSIHTAKRNYFKALVFNWDKPQLNFPADKFPPEKTIYLTLLENNNIKLFDENINYEIKPNAQNRFDELWNHSISFLESAKTSKRNIYEFTSLLAQSPFKLKQGLIDFWLPTFLFIKRDDFALFGENGYIPFFTDEVLDLIAKNPKNYEIKTFAIEGVKLDIFNSYRVFLEQTTKDKLSNSNFIETIKPFLTFYKGLPDYSKNTKRLGKEALAIRTAISNSKDPEQTFFEDFPIALGYSVSKIQNSTSHLQQYIVSLQDAIRELRTCYDELVNRVELFIQMDIIGEELPFEEYKKKLQTRFRSIRRHLLLPKQKIFLQRIDSQIEDKKAWLNSLAQALIGNTLEKVKDEDEIILFDKFKAAVLELDSLNKLSKSDYKEDKEDVFDLQITSFTDGTNKKIVRLPKNKRAEIDAIQLDLRKNLSKNNTLNIAALTNLLKEMLKNE